MRTGKGKRPREVESRAVQVTFKVPGAFLKRFDEVAEAFGYTRTEAIREAMRRFVEQESQKLMNRPENVAQSIRQIIEEGIIAPLIKINEILEKREQKGLGIPVKIEQRQLA